MKICILGDSSCVHIHRIASGMVRRGHEVTVVSHKCSRVPEGVNCVQYKVPPASLSYLSRWEGRRRKYLKKLFKEYDVVNLHFLSDFGLDEEITRKGKFMVSVYGSDIVKPPDLDAYPPETIAMRQKLLRMADAVTTWSCSLARNTEAYADVCFNSILIGPLGVDSALFYPRSSQAYPPTVGFFKGFKAVYGPEVLVKAIPLVLTRVPDARFELISSGPMVQACREELVRSGCVDSVTWFDPRSHEQLPSLLANWDVNVVPSWCESFGAAVLEASAMCIPSVASRVGGLPETMIDGETGFLIEAGDAAGLADRIVAMLLNAELRSQMGTRAREYVQELFHWEKCLDQWEAIYEQTAGGGSIVSPMTASKWQERLDQKNLKATSQMSVALSC